MKVLLRSIFLFILGFGNGLTGSAQIHPILGNFTAEIVDGEVVLLWTIIAGSNCNGIRIYHSANNSAFAEIGEIPGICGYINKPASYSFRDVNPVKNAINNYKLELGSQGFSQLVSIEVIDIASGYQIRPNPATENTRIYFDNDSKTEHEFLLFNIFGKQIYRQLVNQNFIDLNVVLFETGIYYFSISLPGNPGKAIGKLMISH